MQRNGACAVRRRACRQRRRAEHARCGAKRSRFKVGLWNEKSPADAEAIGEESADAASGDVVLPYTRDLEAFLSNPLTELVFAFLCIVLTACTAIDTLSLTETEQAVNASISNAICFVFAMQYVARWWCNADRPLRYIISPLAIIDLCSILSQVWPPLVLFRFTRLLRFARLLQREDYLNVMRILRSSTNSDDDDIVPPPPEWQLQLNRVLFTILSLLVITADLIYNVEHDVNPSIDNFFDGLYFATVSLNSVGYGDIVPVTSAGRAVTSVAILVAALLVPYELSQLAGSLLRVEEDSNGRATLEKKVLPAREESPARALRCSQCSASSHASDAVFCRVCGTKL